MLRRLFLDHPASVGETYWEHQGQAFGFGSRMLIAGLACLIHGLVPALFLHTGSRTIVQLHKRMVSHRRVGGAETGVSAPRLEAAE